MACWISELSKNQKLRSFEETVRELICQSKAGRERSQEERTAIRTDHRSEEVLALICCGSVTGLWVEEPVKPEGKFSAVTTTS